MSRLRNNLILASLPIAAACSPGPIAWDRSASAPPIRVDDGSMIQPLTFPGTCPNSISRDVSPSGVFAAWWSLRPDSTADVMVSKWSQAGWSAPMRVDSTDAGRVGCDRPAPAIAVDGANVHVVYSMAAREGPGVFLAHSMDGAQSFHSPVAVVYGQRPANASVAAKDNFVVVAYEDPNTTPTRISVAVSNTMAHLFEFREVVSPSDAVAATDPLVLVSDRRVNIGWRRTGDSNRVGITGIIR